MMTMFNDDDNNNATMTQISRALARWVAPGLKTGTCTFTDNNIRMGLLSTFI